MTVREAAEAAEKLLPVRCEHLLGAEKKQIQYARITKVGYRYSSGGEKKPFVELYDACRHSVTEDVPENCEVVEEKE